jgi:outer membrane protein TolC
VIARQRLLVLLLVLPLSFLGGRARAARYTLRELVQKVASEAPTVEAARLGLTTAQAALRTAQFGWLPTGDLMFLLSGSSNVLCNPLSFAENPANDTATVSKIPQSVREANCLRTTVVSLTEGSLADIAPVHGVLLRLEVNVNQELYSFGRLESSIAVARAGVDAARANVEKEQAEAVWQATRVYWGIKAAKAAVDTLDVGLSKLQNWIDKIEAELDGKSASKYTETDLIRLKVANAFARIQLVDQRRHLDVATEALRVMTGDPAAQIDDSELEIVEEGSADLQTWRGRAERSRPEVRLLRAGEAAALGNRSGRLSELLPDLSFNTVFGAGYASSMDTPHNYYFNRPTYVNATFGLVLRQPLDFGVRTARWQQAKHEDEATRARSRAAALGFEIETTKAFIDWQEARQRAKEAARGEKLSRGWISAVGANINAGLYADGRELVDVMQSYFLFRLRGFQAIYDANVALAWLRRTAGTLDDTR